MKSLLISNSKFYTYQNHMNLYVQIHRPSYLYSWKCLHKNCNNGVAPQLQIAKVANYKMHDNYVYKSEKSRTTLLYQAIAHPNQNIIGYIQKNIYNSLL